MAAIMLKCPSVEISLTPLSLGIKRMGHKPHYYLYFKRDPCVNAASQISRCL